MTRPARRTKWDGAATERAFIEALYRVERGSSVMLYAVLASEQRLIKRLETPAERLASRIESIRIFLRMNSDLSEAEPDDLVSVQRDVMCHVADCNVNALAALEARVAAIEGRLGIAPT
jgi:hypothetical protein